MLTSLAPASANSRASSPGWSGTETKTERVGRAGPPCLPGIARVPATPSRQQRLQRRPVGRSPTASITASSRSRTSPSRSSTGVGVGRDDLAVELRVARGHPGDVADALAGQRQVAAGRVGQPAGDQGGEQVRQVRGPGHRPVVLHRASAGPVPRRTAATSASTRSTAVRVGRLVRRSPPTAGRRRAPRSPPAARSARCRPSGARRRTAPTPGDVGARRRSGPDFTLPTSVTTASDARSARRSRRRGGPVGPRPRPAAAGPRRCAAGRHRARTRCGGGRTTSSLSSTSSPARRQARPIEVPSRPAPIDLDRAARAAGQAHSSGTDRTRVRSLRSAAAPCR